MGNFMHRYRYTSPHPCQETPKKTPPSQFHQQSCELYPPQSKATAPFYHALHVPRDDGDTKSRISPAKTATQFHPPPIPKQKLDSQPTPPPPPIDQKTP